MHKTDRVFGTSGLILEGIAFAAFVIFFIAARFEFEDAHLPLPKSFIHYILLSVFLAGCLGLVGLIGDHKRSRCIIVLYLMVPLLAVMGVLNGSF